MDEKSFRMWVIEFAYRRPFYRCQGQLNLSLDHEAEKKENQLDAEKAF